MSDNILREFREFTRAYIDDIFTYSITLDNHLKHLFELFRKLDSINFSLSLVKTYISYPSLNVLGYRVSSVGITIPQEKLAVILDIKFPTTLKDLEYYLGLIGWLRNYVLMYAKLSEPL